MFGIATLSVYATVHPLRLSAHRYVECEVGCDELLPVTCAPPIPARCADHGRLYQMDVRTSCFVRRLKSMQGRVLCVCEGARPHEMITGGQDGTILIWDLRAGKKLAQHAVHSSAVCCVSAVEGRIFSSSWDQAVVVTDLEAKTRARLCTGTALKFVPEDKPFKPFTNIQLSSLTPTTASPRKDVPSTCPGLWAWALGEGEVTDDGSHTSTYIHDICKPSGGSVHKLVVNRALRPPHASEAGGDRHDPPGAARGATHVYCAYADGCVRRWDVEKRRIDKTLIAHSASATALHLDDAAGNLFSGSEDGRSETSGYPWSYGRGRRRKKGAAEERRR